MPFNKKLKKTVATCEECDEPLSPVDLAFHPGMCGKCQWKANEEFRQLILPVLKNNGIIKSEK